MSSKDEGTGGSKGSSNSSNSNTGNTNQMDDKVDERYQLSSSDAPRAMIIYKPLDGSNYTAWSRAMKIPLGAKEKLDFVNGKCKPPANVESKEYRLWKKADYMVHSWLLSSISNEMSDNFLYASSAHELWTVLRRDMEAVMVCCCLILRKKSTMLSKVI